MKEIRYRQELTFFFAKDKEQICRHCRDRRIWTCQKPTELVPQRVAFLGSGNQNKDWKPKFNLLENKFLISERFYRIKIAFHIQHRQTILNLKYSSK